MRNSSATQFERLEETSWTSEPLLFTVNETSRHAFSSYGAPVSNFSLRLYCFSKSDENQADLFEIPGHQFLSKNRSEGRGVGSEFLIRKEIPFEVLKDLHETFSCSSFESQLIRISHKVESTIMGVTYRPGLCNL